MNTNHIFNRFFVYNPSDQVVYLVDLDIYITAQAVIDLCADFSVSQILGSASLQHALDQGWLLALDASSYSLIADSTNNDSSFSTSFLFRAYSFSGSSYSYNKPYYADVVLVGVNISYNTDLGITDEAPDGLTGENYEEVLNTGVYR